MLNRFRRLPLLVYLSLAASLIGGGLEVFFHFFQGSVPAYAEWLAALSAADRTFFLLSFELITHLSIALGLTGLLGVLIYRVLAGADRDQR